MKAITIDASQFFELLKLRDTSMWDIFAQMVDGTPKDLFFTEGNAVLFRYTLPDNLEALKADQALFAKEYSEKFNHYTEQDKPEP